MTSDRDVVIVGYARTPFGRFRGSLSSVPGIQLAAKTVNEALIRSQIDRHVLNGFYAGVGMIASGKLTPARQVLLAAGLPDTIPSLTFDRACCSGMTAVGFAFRDIRLGEADLIVCGGFDNLSTTPLLWPRITRKSPGPICAEDPLTLRADMLDQAIAKYTGEEALKFGISREEQDVLAVESHINYMKADDAGYFEDERFCWNSDGAYLDTDENVRRDISYDAISKLNPVYGSPTVTAGNAPGLNDGAGFLVLSSRRFARAHNIQIYARLVDYVQLAGAPTSGTSTPAHAIQKLLKRSGKRLFDLSHIEVNEAFAATLGVSSLILSDGDRAAAARLRKKMNPAGGAVAIGHPLGASGARIVMTMVNGLRRGLGGIGAAAICGGFGQGDGILIEV